MIELYTAPTPNGQKATIMLEELGIPYKVHAIDFDKKEQKEPWYLKINPNGRIPAIIDHDNHDFAVFESGAILMYLAEKTGKFLPTDAGKRSQVIQWLMFQMSGVGPMQGQANMFYRHVPEKIPFAIQRYQDETRRLFSVLDKQLQGRDYLVDEVSIADFATYPWVRIHAWTGVALDDMPNLKGWLQRMGERPGVQRGLTIPAPLKIDLEKAARELVEQTHN